MALGISPGGLTHSAYCGHSFWDAETWVLPSLVALFPGPAADLLAYRAARLPAAQDSARLQGLPCAAGGVAGHDSVGAGGAGAEGGHGRYYGSSGGGEVVPCAVWPWESALLGSQSAT